MKKISETGKVTDHLYRSLLRADGYAVEAMVANPTRMERTHSFDATLAG